MQVTAVAWMDRDAGVITLGENGIVSTWTRSVSIEYVVYIDISSRPAYLGGKQVAMGEDTRRIR